MSMPLAKIRAKGIGMIRLVAVDIDDTLMDSRRSIPQANLDAIGRIRRLGVEVVLVTGRMYCRALPYARMLELAPEQIMISYNGALLKRINGEEISHTPLEPGIALELVRYLQTRGLTIQAYHDDQLFVEKIDANVEYYMRMSELKLTLSAIYTVLSPTATGLGRKCWRLALRIRWLLRLAWHRTVLVLRHRLPSPKSVILRLLIPMPLKARLWPIWLPGWGTAAMKCWPLVTAAMIWR